MLQNLAVENTVLEEWLTETLLPVVYWHHKMQQTKHCCAKEKYQQAWEQASEALKEHPFSAILSESEIVHWLAWATNMSQQFQRSSSAVEGRNGCLSQMYHNGRGLSDSSVVFLPLDIGQIIGVCDFEHFHAQNDAQIIVFDAKSSDFTTDFYIGA